MKIFQPLLLATSTFLCFLSSSLDAANPAEAKTIGRTVREMPELSNFLQLLEKTGIGSILSENTSTSYTVFAPTDTAFKKLPKGTVQTLLDPRNDDRLEEVFGFHVKEISEASEISFTWNPKTSSRRSSLRGSSKVCTVPLGNFLNAVSVGANTV